MPKDTPSMAKNKMRRCFAAILDPHPPEKEIDKLWEFFQSSCAYCGISIDRASRTGHLDHVISTSSGGNNGIHNHVLSCSRCNGDEKREELWETFLLCKVASTELALERKAKIEAWLHGAPDRQNLSEESRAIADQAIHNAMQSFDQAVEVLRRLRAKNS